MRIGAVVIITLLASARFVAAAPSPTSGPAPRPPPAPFPTTPRTISSELRDRDRMINRPGQRARQVVIIDVDTPLLEGRAAADPASGRGIAAPTALVSPKGARGISMRTPLGPMGHLMAVYVPVARVELGAGLFISSADKATGGVSASVRVQAARMSRAAVAVFLEMHSTSDDAAYDAGVVASVCADGAACRALLSVHVGTIQRIGGPSYPVAAGGSFAIGRRYQVVGEGTAALRDGAAAGMAYLGGRLVSGTLAFDAGLALGRAIGVCRLSCDEPTVMTLGPAVAITVRN